MRVLSCDQSLSKAAYMLTVDGEVTLCHVSRTGKTTNKKKYCSCSYYQTLQEQIRHVVADLEHLVETHKPDIVVLENISLGSTGSAAKDLAALWGAMLDYLHRNDIPYMNVNPLSLKSYLRGLLPVDMQYQRDTLGRVVYLKSKKPKLKKMEKRDVMDAVFYLKGTDFCKEYTNTGERSGREDLCDSYVLNLIGQESLKV